MDPVGAPLAIAGTSTTQAAAGEAAMHTDPVAGDLVGRCATFIPTLRRTTSGDKEPLPPLTPELATRFRETLRDYNRESLRGFRARFIHELEKRRINLEAAETAVAITGSDGRGEKPGEKSPFELIVIPKALREHHTTQPSPPPLPPAIPDTGTTGIVAHCARIERPQASPPEAVRDTVEKVEAVVQTAFRTVASTYVDVKPLSGEKGLINTLTLNPGNEKVVPTRPLDAVLIAGSQEAFHQYQRAFVDELQKREVALGAFRKDFVLQARSVLRKQLAGQNESGVDLTKGLLTFNSQPKTKEEKTQKGPKYGALRFFQYSIAYRISQHIENITQAEAEQFVATLPKNVIERVHFLNEHGILHLSPQDIQEIETTYENLTLWYAVLQDRAERSTDGGPVTAQVEPSLLRKTHEDALRLGEKILGTSP